MEVALDASKKSKFGFIVLKLEYIQASADSIEIHDENESNAL